MSPSARRVAKSPWVERMNPWRSTNRKRGSRTTLTRPLRPQGAWGRRTVMPCWPWGTRLVWFPLRYSSWPPPSPTACPRPLRHITRSATMTPQSRVNRRNLSLTARYKFSVCSFISPGLVLTFESDCWILIPFHWYFYFSLQFSELSDLTDRPLVGALTSRLQALHSQLQAFVEQVDTVGKAPLGGRDSRVEGASPPPSPCVAIPCSGDGQDQENRAEEKVKDKKHNPPLYFLSPSWFSFSLFSVSFACFLFLSFILMPKHYFGWPSLNPIPMCYNFSTWRE